MTDIDERVGRAGSQPRFQSIDLQQATDPLSKLISDFEHTGILDDRDLLELLRKVEQNNPERCTKAPKFVAQLLTHKNAEIRKSAFKSALTILSHEQNPRQMLLDAYRLALCCSDRHVAQYALSLLPNFVDTCPEEANNLIKFGSLAYNKMPAPSTDSEMYLARAVTKASQ
ncbi:unnamed protein product [Caenorhabditis sp. 36 PRJEB53466]|nr:unnamed protein product [Caenorhabditis sp. 36 PRJEB53466]